MSKWNYEDIIKKGFVPSGGGNYGKPGSPANPRAVAKLESNLGHEPLGAKKVQGPTGKRFLVCVTSYRKRLIDEDNLCEKYHVDLCRYAGFLPSDAPEVCSIQTTQVKSKEEYIEIKIVPIA